MGEQWVTLSTKDSIGIVSLNRPPANSYNLEFMEQLDKVVDEIRRDEKVKVAVLTSSAKFFSAGADIDMLKESTPDYKAYFCLNCQEVMNKIERTPKIFVAAINGHCVGGGLEIALACDLRFMANGNFLIGLPEVKLGVLPGVGGTQRLPRLIGKGRALEMIITGKTITPEEALAIGLVNRIFPAEELREKTFEFAKELATGATRAIGLIKLSIQEGIEMPLTAGLALERELQNRLFITEDAREGVRAFLEKRAANFSGR